MTGILRLARDGAVARVSLSRPEAHNAFDAALIHELTATFNALGAEPADALRVVVLAGDGKTFSAGADVEWMHASMALSVDENAADAARMAAMFAAIDSCPAPVIARVHGAALGGGMGLCAVADIVLASADATFGFTETKLGLLPAVISPFVLAKIGESHARALFPSGERFGAERARHIGLVHEVLADEAALDARLESVIAELLAAGPTAARAAKAVIRDLRTLSATDARAHTVRHIAQQRTSAEGQEGLRAFLEKRPPSWKG